MTDIKGFADEVAAERAYQAGRWGDGTDESLDATDWEKNGPIQFVAYIAHTGTRWFPGSFPPFDKETVKKFRSSMVKVAALAYAAIRWADRKLAEKIE